MRVEDSQWPFVFLTLTAFVYRYTVLNIDRGPGPGTGSTSFSAGINRTFYSALQPCLMAYEGFHVYSNWEEHLRSHGAPEDPDGYAKLRVTGGCVIRSDTAESFFQNTTACHEEVIHKRALHTITTNTTITGAKT